MSDKDTVYIVDDDHDVRWALTSALEVAGFSPQAFSSAEQFLENLPDSDSGCILLDIKMPGMGGPALQDELKRRGIMLPIVIITGHADVETAVKVMRDGALDLLQKPCSTATLVNRLRDAIDLQKREAEGRRRRAEVRRMVDSLSRRERNVLDEILNGKTNKQIAAILNIGIQTVAKHKARVLQKLSVKNELELMLLFVGQTEIIDDVKMSQK